MLYTFLCGLYFFYCCLVAQSCPTLSWPHGLYSLRLLWPWNFPGKNTGVGCHLLLQGIFLTQGWNPHLLLGRQILYQWVTWETLHTSCCCCCYIVSVVSNSVQHHRRQPTRLPHPWDSPGKNTGVDCHFLLQCMKVKSESEVAQSCPTLSDPMDCSLPGSSVHGIFQVRVLEWGAIAFSVVLPKFPQTNMLSTSISFTIWFIFKRCWLESLWSLFLREIFIFYLYFQPPPPKSLLL